MKVIPFPLVRRRPLVRKAARSMATRGHEQNSADPASTGKKMLAATLKRQREQLCKRGIEPTKIETEIAALERAIRSEHARPLAIGVVA